MKKVSKLLLVAVLALGMGLTACNNDDLPGGPDAEKGNTHVSVTLRMSSSATRAAGDNLPGDYNYVGDWAGKDKIEKITVYLVDGASVNSSIFSVAATGADYDITTTGNDILLKPNTNAAIKTTAGQKTVYVVVNENAVVRNWLNKTPVHEFEQAYQNLSLVLENEESSATTSASKVATMGTADETIVMTSVKPAVVTVEEGISAEETIKAAKNRATLNVERMVARAMVTIKDTPVGGFSIPDPNTNGATSLGSLTDITWVVAQGEKSLFVQRKADNPWEWATPNWKWVPGDGTANYYADAGSKYDYSGLFEARTNKFGGTDVPTYADYADNKNTDPIELQTRWLDGKFVLPTTHEYAAAPADAGSYTGGYKKGNTTYVLIRAKFTPAEGAWADEGTKAKDGTFYVGENGKFYTSAQAAYDDMGTTKMTKYEGGKVLYYAWLNPDQIPNWYNSPVLRNNIYHIHITGFKNLGTNWNPLYPEDPNATDYDPEKPNNPDPKPVPEDVIDPDDPDTPITPEEPENPIDPEDPLTTSETWMSVDVTVLPWKVHSYEVDLGI